MCLWVLNDGEVLITKVPVWPSACFFVEYISATSRDKEIFWGVVVMNVPLGHQQGSALEYIFKTSH